MIRVIKMSDFVLGIVWLLGAWLVPKMSNLLRWHDKLPEAFWKLRVNKMGFNTLVRGHFSLSLSLPPSSPHLCLLTIRWINGTPVVFCLCKPYQSTKAWKTQRNFEAYSHYCIESVGGSKVQMALVTRS